MSRIGVAVVLVLAVGVAVAAPMLLDRRTSADQPPPQEPPRTESATGPGPPSACRQRASELTSYGERGGTLRCFNLPGRLVPPDALAAATVAHHLGPHTFLISFTAFASHQGAVYRIWQRRGRAWTKLFERDSLPDGGNGVSLEDVTQDGRRDVLVQGLAGSGMCGARDVLAVEARRVRPLILRTGCEVLSELKDGLVYLRETVGSCHVPHAHCYGGVRITIRGWTGRRLTTDEQVVRCLRRDGDPRRLCRAA